MLGQVLDFAIPIMVAAGPFAERYRAGVWLLIPTTMLLGSAMASNEIWHWLTPRTFYGINPLAWLAAAAAVTLIYLPRATRRWLRMCQFAGALAAGFLLPALGGWIS